MSTPRWIIAAALVAAVLFFLMNYVMFRVGHRMDDLYRKDDLGADPPSDQKKRDR